MHRCLRRSIPWLLLASSAFAQTPGNVLVVINEGSALSRGIGEYYAAKRAIPAQNVCRIAAPDAETIERKDFDARVRAPIAACLRSRQLIDQVLYIVTTAGVPLRINGMGGADGDLAAVDSELTLLYPFLKDGREHPLKGYIPNPFFGKRDTAFTRPEFPIYLVTRLAAYDLAGARALVDRSLAASNRGKFVIDLSGDNDQTGNDWLRDTMIRLPRDRVVFDASPRVLSKQKDVIGYASWGSNDTNHKERLLGFQWLPGAIATEYVSSNGRTFMRPPKDWKLSDWSAASRPKWFAGSPQSLAADYLEEGASAVTGHVYEPYLAATPRPELLLPAYYQGRNLAESFYISVPALSWQNIVIGDPLMSLGPPAK